MDRHYPITTCLWLLWFSYYHNRQRGGGGGGGGHLTKYYRNLCFIQYCHRLLVIISWFCWLGDHTFQRNLVSLYLNSFLRPFKKILSYITLYWFEKFTIRTICYAPWVVKLPRFYCIAFIQLLAPSVFSYTREASFIAPPGRHKLGITLIYSLKNVYKNAIYLH